MIRNPEDVDTNAEDHAYDALRYGCMSRPHILNLQNDLDISTLLIKIVIEWQ